MTLTYQNHNALYVFPGVKCGNWLLIGNARLMIGMYPVPVHTIPISQALLWNHQSIIAV